MNSNQGQIYYGLEGKNMHQGLDITYYLITQFTGLLILAIAMIIFIFSIQKVANKLAKKIENQTSELNRLNESYQDSQKVLMSVFSQIEQISNNNNELNNKISSLQQELSLLSSDYSDNQQISQAIELARKGSNTKTIVEKTGLSSEEVDAIVKFYGDENKN